VESDKTQPIHNHKDLGPQSSVSGSWTSWQMVRVGIQTSWQSPFTSTAGQECSVMTILYQELE